MRLMSLLLAAACVAAFSPACAPRPQGPAKPDVKKTTVAKASPAKADGFKNMFNLKDTTGWTCKPGSWVFDGDVLTRKGGGSIWSKDTYGDFILDLEFKVAKGTNSGVFIRTGSIRQWLHTGMEVQVMDSHGRAKAGKHDCGAIYDCLAPSVNATWEAGKWNRMIITAKANKIGIVMNGKPIIDMDLNRWTEAHKNPDGSKNKFKTAYKDMPRRGHVGFQDHGRPVWYKNVRIKTLD